MGRTFTRLCGLLAFASMHIVSSASAQTLYQYDSRGRLAAVDDRTAKGTETLYSYDDTGNRKNVQSFARAKRDGLQVGDRLNAGETILSTNSRTRLTLRNDGNLVLIGASGRTLWESATSGRRAAYLVQQADGHLVLYDSQNVGVWASLVYGFESAGTSYLAVQDDGNLVVYSGSNSPKWHTNTSVQVPFW